MYDVLLGVRISYKNGFIQIQSLFENTARLSFIINSFIKNRDRVDLTLLLLLTGHNYSRGYRKVDPIQQYLAILLGTALWR